jgi:hypothetical protein
MVRHGYVAYMFDVRNYGFSPREKAMEEPAKENRPLAPSRISKQTTNAFGPAFSLGPVVSRAGRQH